MTDSNDPTSNPDRPPATPTRWDDQAYNVGTFAVYPEIKEWSGPGRMVCLPFGAWLVTNDEEITLLFEQEHTIPATMALKLLAHFAELGLSAEAAFDATAQVLRSNPVFDDLADVHARWNSTT